MTVPDTSDFDEWYAIISASSRWDPFVGHWLGLPETVQSTGYLSGAGLGEVMDRLRLTPQETLVEVGCGRAGYGLAAIEGSGAQLVGIDFSAQALRSAGGRAEKLGLGERARFLCADLSTTGLADGLADAVLCVDAIHFASSVSAAVAECLRILRPGGRLVITTWEASRPDVRSRLPERIRRMNIRRDLIETGFVDVEVNPRPAWSQTEVSFWEAAAALDPDGDLAMAALRDEAVEFLPLADALRRLLVVARTPD